MGAILALPLAFLGNVLVQIGLQGNQLTSKPSGFTELVKRILVSLYLKFRDRGRSRRLDFYESPTLNPLYAFHFSIPPEEWELDLPKQKKGLDEAFFYGVNHKGAALVARIAKLGNSQSEVSLYLKLENGKSYILPRSEPFVLRSQDMFSFRGGALKMECREPMRRWRISYNGIMKELGNDSEEDIEVHMRFSFQWMSLTALYDFDDDVHPKLEASLLAKLGWSDIIQALKQSWPSLSEVHRYEQGGYIIGTYSINSGEETEMYLWGTRARIHGPPQRNHQLPIIRIFGYDKYGSFLHLGYSYTAENNFCLHYGYVMHPKGFMWPLESYTVHSIIQKQQNHCPEKLEMEFVAKRKYTLHVTTLDDQAVSFKHNLGQQGDTTSYLINIKLNKYDGKGVLLLENKFPLSETSENEPSHDEHIWASTKNTDKHPLVVSFLNPLCKTVSLSGGKGASLAVLKEDSLYSSKYIVPDGIVVTTNAYKLIMENERLKQVVQNLEDVAWSRKAGNLNDECERVMNEFKNAKLPEAICKSVTKALQEMFGNKLEETKFAVRSSGSGEDSEDLSAAGQMETFLGVQSLDKIFTAILNCWASQFGPVAISYKRSNGQLLNMDMAVVIQEMVPSEVAGVMFTCDPVSGDPRMIHITANYGLGESVVSASAEPDTILMKRNHKNEFAVDSINIGSKKTRIVMDHGEKGTHEDILTTEDSSVCCLSEKRAISLTAVGIHLEEVFGCSRDLEWAIADDKIYLLQARPVTSTDVETRFETMHSHDSGHLTDSEYWTKANVGEVAPGSFSPLGLYFVYKLLCPVMFANAQKQKGIRRYYISLMGYSLYQMFINLLESNVVLRKDHKTDAVSRADSLQLMGKTIHLDDDEVVHLWNERRDEKTSWALMKQYYVNLKCHLACDAHLQNAYKEIWKDDIALDNCETAAECLKKIGNKFIQPSQSVLGFTLGTMVSSFLNCIVLAILSSHKNNDDGEISIDVYSDFANLMASCPTVESADVPSALKKLAAVVTREMDPKKFKDLPAAEALNWLENSTSDAGKAFREFLERHGHRCLKECDLFSRPWREDKIQLINSLQAVVTLDPNDGKKQEISVKEAISNIKVPLSMFKRLLLRLLLPQCRKAVSYREMGKSLVVKSIDLYRKAFRKLSDMMVKEGYIPDADLMFFLSLEETELLLRTRNPILIARAKRRKQIIPELNDIRFPEIVKGPLNPVKSLPLQSDHSSSLLMRGKPVSRGIVKARARVANNLKEAAALQPGEILITYSTDIGWSPYFPLISGLATELGGLISHGAVIAREYGLPCIVGVNGATSLFKSGDFVILDAINGTLAKIEEEATSQ